MPKKTSPPSKGWIVLLHWDWEGLSVPGDGDEDGGPPLTIHLTKGAARVDGEQLLKASSADDYVLVPVALVELA